MALFSITCETCGARLKVRSVRALGQIVGCPKCGSMIQVVAPEGWAAPPIASAATTESEVPPADEAAASQQQTAGFGNLAEPAPSRSGLWLAIAAVGLLAVAGLGAAWSLFAGTTEVAQAPSPRAVPESPADDAEAAPGSLPEVNSEPADSAEPTANPKPELTTETSDPTPTESTAEETAPDEPPASEEVPTSEPADPAAKPTEPAAAAETQAPPAATPPATSETAGKPASDAPVPAVARRPRSQDLRARLATPLSGITFTNVALGDVLDTLSQLAGVPIALDAHNVPDAARLAATPISADLASITVGAATTAVIRDLGLEGVLFDGQVLIELRGARAGRPQSKSYDLGDLTSTMSAEQADALREFLAQLAGTAPQPTDRKFTLTANPDRQRLVTEALARLRAGRQASAAARPRHPADRWTRSLTLNFRQPTPLMSIVRELENEAQATLLIDWPALAAAGQDLDAEVSFVVEDQPLATVLADFAKSQRLAWVTLDENARLLTSPARAAGFLRVESYPLGHFGPAPLDAQQIAAALPAAAGGNAARVWIDPIAKRVLVAGSAPLHEAIAGGASLGE